MDRKRTIIEWLQQPDNNFCAMPFIHMAIEANGGVRPCCMADPLDTQIQQSSIGELQYDQQRIQMQQQFIENKQFPNCSICWKDKSKFSPRITFSTSVPAIEFTYQIMQGATPKNELTWLEIKPGNRCNLKCRICGVHNSSSWAKDNYKVQGTTKPYKQTETYQWQKQCEWVDEDDQWLDVSGLEKIKHIHVMGGEPFMITRQFEFLQRFADTYDVSDVQLWYNTNGTLAIPEQYTNLLDSMGSVFITVSIDDIEERYNYQRHGVAWEQARYTVNQLFDLNTKQNYRVQLDPTVSIYNVLYLNQFVEYCSEHNWHLPHNQSHYVNNINFNNIRTLRTDQKQKIIQVLSQCEHSNHSLVKSTLDFIQTDLWSEQLEIDRIDIIKKLDAIRNENLAQTFPELNRILEIYP